MGILSKATVHAHDALDKAADAAAPGEQWLEERGLTLAANGEKFPNGACKYIAAHPLQSVGLALAAGYLLGRLTQAFAHR